MPVHRRLAGDEKPPVDPSLPQGPVHRLPRPLVVSALGQVLKAEADALPAAALDHKIDPTTSVTAHGVDTAQAVVGRAAAVLTKELEADDSLYHLRNQERGDQMSLVACLQFGGLAVQESFPCLAAEEDTVFQDCLGAVGRGQRGDTAQPPGADEPPDLGTDSGAAAAEGSGEGADVQQLAVLAGDNAEHTVGRGKAEIDHRAVQAADRQLLWLQASYPLRQAAMAVVLFVFPRPVADFLG